MSGLKLHRNMLLLLNKQMPQYECVDRDVESMCLDFDWPQLKGAASSSLVDDVMVVCVSSAHYCRCRCVAICVRVVAG